MILCFRWGLSEKNARLRVILRRNMFLRTVATRSDCSKEERRSPLVRTLSTLTAPIAFGLFFLDGCHPVAKLEVAWLENFAGPCC